jgi:hypothetical protein
MQGAWLGLWFWRICFGFGLLFWIDHASLI